MVLGLFWALYVIAIFLPMRWCVYLFFVGTAFGSFNTVPGSITLIPYAVCAPLLIGKILIANRNGALLSDALLNWKRLGILTGFLLVTVLVTIVAPRLFAGVPIMGLNTLLVTPLSPNAGNITQTIYLSTSFAICVAIYLLFLMEGGRRILAHGILLAGSTLIIAGLLDMATAGTSILSIVRTASYSIMVDNEVAGGVRRVIGFNTEASAYGAATLAFGSILLFVRPARHLDGFWRHAELPLALLLLVFSALSTSTSAYLGLAMLLIVGTLDLTYRLVTEPLPSLRRQNVITAATAIAAAAAIAIFLLAFPRIAMSGWDVIDAMVLQKRSSDSYVERANWSRVSLDALIATGGFGVGAGSTRASNWLIAVASCSGLVGVSLLAAFMLRTLLAPIPRGDETIRSMAVGARYVIVIVLVPALGAGASVDFGLVNAMMFAIVAAVPMVIAPPVWLIATATRQAPLRFRPRQRPLVRPAVRTGHRS